MANLFVNLPLPVLNGPGAAVDTSAMGSVKTIACVGTFSGATITIEASVDGGVEFAPVTTFQSSDENRVRQVVAQFMRVNVSGRKSAVPFSANIDVGANDNGSLFAAIPMPAANGPGASVNTSTFGLFSTFIAGGSFVGAAVLVEVSEDGVDWSPLVQFTGAGGLQSRGVTAQFVRANVSGRKDAVPFSATLAVGASTDPSALALGSPSNCFIFQEGGGQTGPVVFDDFNDLYAALQAQRAASNASGCYRIQFDDSIVSPETIPVGAYDMTDVTLEGHPNILSTVFVVEGVSFTKLRRVDNNMNIFFSGATPPVTDFLSDAGARDTYLQRGSGGITCTGTGPFFEFNEVGGPGALIAMLDGAQINTGSVPALDLTAAGVIVFGVVGMSSSIQSDTVEGALGSVFILVPSVSSAVVSEDQTAFTGAGGILLFINVTIPRWNPTTTLLVAPTTIAPNDIARVDPTAGSVPITLPPAFNNRGVSCIVLDATGAAVPITNEVTILPDGADTINLAATEVIDTAFGSRVVISDGVSNWMIVADA